jgi:hypothetical protein
MKCLTELTGRLFFDDITFSYGHFSNTIDMKIISLVTICCFSLIFDAKGQGAYPPLIDGAEEITYKTVDGTKLNLWIFKPRKP